MKKANLSSVISHILALFLTFTLFAVSGCALFVCTVSDPNLMDRTITESNYLKPLKQEISDKWDNLAAICGMSEREELINLLTEERIEADSREYFKNAYNGETIDTSALKEKVHKVVSDYAYKNDWGLISKAELEQNINDLVTSCMDEYDSSIKVKLMPKLLSATLRYRKIALIGLGASTILSVGILVFIYFLQTPRRKTAFYAFTAFGANALLYGFIVLFVMINGLINRIPIEASALHNLVNRYLQDILNSVSMLTISLLVISALILILYLIPKKKTNAQ